jgi:hypothetical protein
MQESYMDKTVGQINMEFEEFEYRKPLGAFKPKFAGIPENYFPLTCSEALLYSLIVFLTIGGTFAIMIGLLFWVTTKGLSDFVTVWSIISIMFILILIPAFYVGGKGRIREEKRLIN